MHIIITRPKEESINLIDSLIKSGHLVTHLPVIKIKKLETQKINFQNYKAVIFTSGNAIKYMNIEKFDFKIKCFCVGTSTERIAKKFYNFLTILFQFTYIKKAGCGIISIGNTG